MAPVAADKAAMSPVVADEAAAHPGIPGLVCKLEDPPMRSGQAAGIPRLAYPKAAVPAPEPALFREPAESAPEPALFREPTESTPEPALFREPTESAPEPALFREPAESAPEPALFREPAESAPEPALFREPAESAPESALFREPAESAPEPALFREPTESTPGVCSPVLICCLASCVYIECTKLSACLFFPFGWFLFLVLFHYLKDPLPTFESSPSSLQSIPDIYG